MLILVLNDWALQEFRLNFVNIFDLLFSGILNQDFDLGFFQYSIIWQVFRFVVFRLFIQIATLDQTQLGNLRAIGLNPQVVRFVFFYFNSFLLHLAGELIGIGMLGMIGDPTLANSVCALTLSISCLLSSGLVRWVFMVLVDAYL